MDWGLPVLYCGRAVASNIVVLFIPQMDMSYGVSAHPTYNDWLRGWKEWARTRKRGKMAQFIVDKLEENVSCHHTYTSFHTHTHTHMHTHAQIYMYIYTCTQTHLYTGTHTHTHIHTLTYTHSHTCTLIHIHTLTYTHSHTVDTLNLRHPPKNIFARDTKLKNTR